jgi:hypothetical protein
VVVLAPGQTVVVMALVRVEARDRTPEILLSPGSSLSRLRSKSSMSRAISRHCCASSKYIFRSISSLTGSAARSHSRAFLLQVST